MKEGAQYVETEEYGGYHGIGVCHHWRTGAADWNPVQYTEVLYGGGLSHLSFRKAQIWTLRYPREKTVERIAYIKGLRDQKKTIPQIKEILQEKDKIV